MVNVTARINARKIVLSYFYEYCFFYKFKNQESAIKEILFIDNIFQSNDESFQKEKSDFLSKIDIYFKEDYEDRIDYYITKFYDKWPSDTIDFDYIKSMCPYIGKYLPEVIETVDKHSNTFGYNKMDSIDQALFVLWYIEWKEIKTVKEILLNELIELSKRYADDWSSRLINGIMHNVFATTDSTDSK